MTSEFISITGDGFAAVANRNHTRIDLTLRGTAALDQQKSVASLLEQLHSEAMRMPAREAIVDFRELEFMNSSCFKSFVTWISNIRKLESSKQYKVLFRCNPALHWQKRSLDALRCFAVDLITVDGLV